MSSRELENKGLRELLGVLEFIGLFTSLLEVESRAPEDLDEIKIAEFTEFDSEVLAEDIFLGTLVLPFNC